MGNALRTRCPNCEKVVRCDVVRTDPGFYIWSDEQTKLFKEMWGRDIWFRQRERRCSSCNDTLLTVEFYNKFLENCMKEIVSSRRMIELNQAHVKVFTEGPGLIKLLCDTFSADAKIDVVKCWKNMQEHLEVITRCYWHFAGECAKADS